MTFDLQQATSHSQGLEVCRSFTRVDCFAGDQNAPGNIFMQYGIRSVCFFVLKVIK